MAVRGVLLDLEGVLYQDGEAIAGAAEAVHALTQGGVAVRFLTNTTTRPRREVVSRMAGMGFEVSASEVFTPARAADRLLAAEGIRRVHLAAPPALAEDLASLEPVDEAPEAVVMGDLHTGFTWECLDGLFRMLIGGARLVALHRNRFCRRAGSLALDLGPFVAALEYAAGTQALVVGKPARAFFAAAVADMGLEPATVIMVGDDIEADIGGALDAGLRALQVRTGKHSERDENHANVRPTARIGSIADLRAWMDKAD